MKVAAVFVLVVGVVFSYAAPAPREVDWSAVSSKIEEIEAGGRSAVDQIKTIAKNDNDKVGSSISDQLDAAYTGCCCHIQSILQQAKDAASDHSLTEDQARDLMNKLKNIFTQIQKDLQDELGELSDTAASKIGGIFHATLVSSEKKAKELYALLHQ